MFIDHKDGRCRSVFENGDVCKFKHPHPDSLPDGYKYCTAIQVFNLEAFISKLKKNSPIEKGDGKLLILNETLSQNEELTVVYANYFDARLVQQLNIHRYVVCSKQTGLHYYVTEFDLT